MDGFHAPDLDPPAASDVGTIGLLLAVDHLDQGGDQGLLGEIVKHRLQVLAAPLTDLVEAESLHDAGDKVAAILRQRGRSKTTGLIVDMQFGQLWTLRDGRQVRMQMYASAEETLEAAGLTE